MMVSRKSSQPVFFSMFFQVGDGNLLRCGFEFATLCSLDDQLRFIASSCSFSCGGLKYFWKHIFLQWKKNNNKSCSIKYVFVYVCHTRRWFWGSKKSHADISAPISRDHPHVFLDQSDCVRVKPPFLGRLGPWFFMIVSHSAVKQPSG
jgi:uncharacterized Zn-finger protein